MSFQRRERVNEGDRSIGMNKRLQRKPGLAMTELASDQGVVELASDRTPVVMYELDGGSSEMQSKNPAGNDNSELEGGKQPSSSARESHYQVIVQNGG